MIFLNNIIALAQLVICTMYALIFIGLPLMVVFHYPRKYKNAKKRIPNCNIMEYQNMLDYYPTYLKYASVIIQ